VWQVALIGHTTAMKPIAISTPRPATFAARIVSVCLLVLPLALVACNSGKTSKPAPVLAKSTSGIWTTLGGVPLIVSLGSSSDSSASSGNAVSNAPARLVLEENSSGIAGKLIFLGKRNLATGTVIVPDYTITAVGSRSGDTVTLNANDGPYVSYKLVGQPSDKDFVAEVTGTKRLQDGTGINSTWFWRFVKDAPEPTLGLPKIWTFGAKTAKVPKGGGTIELQWFVDNAEKLEISSDGSAPTEYSPDSTGTKGIFIGKNTTLTLKTSNRIGTSTSQTTIEVATGDQASIDSFTATPNVLESGGGLVRLQWVAKDASNIKLLIGNERPYDVTGLSEKWIEIKQSTPIVLLATSSDPNLPVAAITTAVTVK
jgi:hypothetical protein